MWESLQSNDYHKWVASELVTPSMTGSQPFLDPIMSSGFVLIAIVAIGNFLTSL